MNDTSENPGNLASLTNGPVGMLHLHGIREQKILYGQSKRMKHYMIHVIIIFTPEGVTAVDNAQGST